MCQPNFERIKTALLRCEPDRVPLAEGSVDVDVKSAFLGRPIRTLEDEVEFWYRAGYDYIPLACGIRLMFSMGFSSDIEPQLGELVRAVCKDKGARYSIYSAGERVRVWAEERCGIITTRDELRRFPFPRATDFDYSAFDDVKPLLPDGMKVIPYLGWVFTPAWMLMGFETFCLAVKEDEALIAELTERIGSLQYEVLEIVTSFDCVGAVWLPDDIAYTEGLMVHPDVLRKYVFPWLKRMCELCHQRGLPVIYHSDGKLYEVIDDIIDCGFDALHPIEPKAMDIVHLKRVYGKRLCLMGNIDLGYTLTRGTPEEVIEEVKNRIRDVAPGGGYCVGSSNSVTEYVPLENFNAMREAVFEYGRYPISV